MPKIFPITLHLNVHYQITRSIILDLKKTFKNEDVLRIFRKDVQFKEESLRICLEWLNNYINTWSAKQIFKKRKEILIKNIPQTLSIYVMSCFLCNEDRKLKIVEAKHWNGIKESLRSCREFWDQNRNVVLYKSRTSRLIILESMLGMNLDQTFILS